MLNKLTLFLNKTYNKILLIGIVFLGTGFSNSVSALQGGTPGGTKLLNPLAEDSIIKIISNILNWLIYFSVPILSFMILIGGFQILTARDKPEQIKSGRTTILYAVIGFTIILVSKGVALILIKIIS